jgi:hypothetical protein
MGPPSKRISGRWESSLWLVGLLTALAILPVFLVEIPAMLDYPNHLARMYLLAASGTPNENPYYVVTWKLNSNLAMDITVLALGQFLNIATATKVFLLLSQILVVSGSVALEMVVKRRYEFAGLAAVMGLYCVPFAWGLLNFEFATGLALWGIASWVALENRNLFTRLAAHSLFVFCIFVSDFVALGLYGATIGFYKLSRTFFPKLNAKQTIVIFVLLAFPAVVLLSYLVLSGAPTPGLLIAWNAADKLRSILYVFNGYNIHISALYFIIIFMSGYFLFRSRSLKIMPQGKCIAAGLLLIFVALPFQGVLAEVRIVAAAILILPAFLVFSPARPAMRLLLPLVLSVIALLNAGQVATIWIAYQPEYDRLKASFRLMERGAFVLIGRSSEKSDLDRPIYHAPVLAVHYANAFVPSLFTNPGQYALQGRPDLNSVDNEPVPFFLLEEILNGRGPLASRPSHVRCWMVDYDYLYLIGPQGPHPMPSRLTALAAGERFALYRIIKPPGVNAHENTPSGSRTLLGNTEAACLPR